MANDGKPLLIVKTGTAIHQAAGEGDFDDWITARMGVNGSPVVVRRVDLGERLPAPGTVAAAVVTGSSAMVTDRLDWSERTAEWLEGAVAAGIPTFGICYGHQLLAHAFGGRVGDDPAGREIGTVSVRRRPAAGGDALFGDVPEVFFAQATHEQSVVELPAGAIALADSDHPAVHAFRIGRCAWGVQFHPEFDDRVMRTYVRARAATLVNEGLDPDALLGEVRKAPVAAGLLRRFAEFVAGRPD